MTQAFFLQLLDKDWLRTADQEKGAFRAFLLSAMKRFMAKEWRRAHTQKRGGFSIAVPIDTGWAEEQYRYEPRDNITPDMLYEQRWAMALLQQALGQVRADMEKVGKGPLFSALESTLAGGSTSQTYAELASTFGMTESAIKVAVHRMRKRFRDHLLALVEDTVSSPETAQDELRHLYSVFSA